MPMSDVRMQRARQVVAVEPRLSAGTAFAAATIERTRRPVMSLPGAHA
jgi:hypothetical protein